jgi:amino acid transporter
MELQYFGALEYMFGSIKLTFITMLIVMMLILDTMKRQCQFSHCHMRGSNSYENSTSKCLLYSNYRI